MKTWIGLFVTPRCSRSRWQPFDYLSSHIDGTAISPRPPAQGN